MLERLPLGTGAVTTSTEAEIAPGIIFCLRAEGDAAKRSAEAGYPLGAQYLVHVGIKNGADARTRTADLLITNQSLSR